MYMEFYFWWSGGVTDMVEVGRVLRFMVVKLRVLDLLRNIKCNVIKEDFLILIVGLDMYVYT